MAYDQLMTSDVAFKRLFFFIFLFFNGVWCSAHSTYSKRHQGYITSLPANFMKDNEGITDLF